MGELKDPKPPVTPDEVLPPVRKTFAIAKSEPGSGPPVPKDPPKLAAAKRVDARLRRKVERIAEYELAAAEIDDDTLTKPDGWTEVKFRVAKDGRRPSKERPGYLDSNARILKSYHQQDAARNGGDAPPLNVLVAKVEVTNNYSYPQQELPENE